LRDPEIGNTIAFSMGSESILERLKRNLRDAGSARWELIAVQCGAERNLPRKVFYGDRKNPGVQTLQPLIDFFEAVERGEAALPEIPARRQREAA
jgi:hypothetical protein